MKTQPIQPNLFVLAGGFGKRLSSVTSGAAKPMVSVAGKPFLYHQLVNWHQQGIRAFTFLLYHQADSIKNYLQQLRSDDLFADCVFQCVTEPVPMDTGGAIAFAVRELNIQKSFLVTNADTWLGGGIEQMQQANPPAMAVLRLENTDRYGRVTIQMDTYVNKVQGFEEKKKDAGAGWINAGLYYLQPQLFQDWNGQAFSLEKDLFPKLASELRITAVEIDSNFIDIGIPESYFHFCQWIESGKVGKL